MTPDHLASDHATTLAHDRARAVALAPQSVSRETWSRLDRLVTLVVERQQHTNIIAPSTIPQIWTRHVADSLQLLPLAPGALRWVDLGSGAGFPGLAIACALTGTPGAEVHLVESTQKKAAFLSEATRELGLPVVVHPIRIEDFAAKNQIRFDVVTARALAPLPKLLGYAIPLLKTGTVGLFPKGQDVEAELTEASKYWNIQAELVPSTTDPRGRIVVLHRAKKR